MQRHAKVLKGKSKTHKVELSGDVFTVTSGTSGKRYFVKSLSNGCFLCGCKWHEYHKAGECSHTLAVREWLAQAGNRTTQAHATVDEYRRSHRRFEDYNEGLIITSRSAR